MKRPLLSLCLAFILGGGLHARQAFAACDVPMFAGARLFGSANDAIHIATADFNNGGFADLAVINQAVNSVSILLGNGDGTFQPAVNYPTGANSIQVVEADFNGDGKPTWPWPTSGARLSPARWANRRGRGRSAVG
jgi:hypothetical protein